MTSLVLSESDEKIKVKPCKNPELISSTDSINALSHIINTTTDELKETNKRLKDAIDGSRDGLWEVSKESLCLNMVVIKSRAIFTLSHFA